MRGVGFSLRFLPLVAVLCAAQAPAPAPMPVISPVPAPVPVPGLPIECDDTVTGATTGEDSFFGSDTGTSVYTLPLTLPENGILSIEEVRLNTCLEGTDYPTMLYVLPPGATSLDEALCASDPEDGCGPDSDQAQLDCAFAIFNDGDDEGEIDEDEANLYVYIVVTGQDGEEGNYELEVECETATIDKISCGAPVEGDTSSGENFSGGNNHFYLLNALEEEVEVNSLEGTLCFEETDFDARLRIFDLGEPEGCDGTECEDLPDISMGYIEACPLVGKFALIVVDSEDSEVTGSYKLEVDCDFTGDAQ